MAFTELLPIAPLEVREKIQELMAIKAKQDETYLHPKEVLITDFLLETIRFNEQHAKGLGSGKKMGEELDDFFRKCTC